MWLAETATIASSDNIYSLLGIVASAIIAPVVLLLARRRRRDHPDPEPIAQKVATSVETFLQRRIKQLEREKVEIERQLAEERAKTLALTEANATLRSERATLMEREHRARRYRDD